jgi:hypothetical protein
MERGLPHTGLNGSALVGWLARMSLVEGPEVAPSFAEGLARWLSWKDAIALSGALHAPPTAASGHGTERTKRPASSLAATVEREFDRVRTTLVRAISDPSEPPAAETAFAPYRRHCVALQQAMEAGIGPLRTQARVALARCSPAMGRLAAIDAVMEEALGPREHSLLAMMPSLLERHFERLGHAERQAAATMDAAASEGETPQAAPASVQPAAWLGIFRQDMKRLLLAELDLRLQPVQGLLDALGSTSQGFHD